MVTNGYQNDIVRHMPPQEGTSMKPSHIDLTKPSESGCRATREILERIGDKWSLYVVGSLREGPLRFSELRRAIDGVSQRMLTLTLRGLERDGLVTRTVFPSVPPRVDYELTPLGRTLLEPVSILIKWVEQSRPEIEAARARFNESR
ncbi:winged helix-turn-helix transcriptional regulator [Methylovorus sp. SPW-M1]